MTFVAFGDLHKGFARIYCDQCGHDYLLGPVPHRQYAFPLPKLIRACFRYRRQYLGALCCLVAGLLTASFRAMAPQGQPAFILYVQTFGDLVTFNPHILALVAGGVFLASGAFRVLPPLRRASRPDTGSARLARSQR